jgi:hypothetical protein
MTSDERLFKLIKKYYGKEVSANELKVIKAKLIRLVKLVYKLD